MRNVNRHEHNERATDFSSSGADCSRSLANFDTGSANGLIDTNEPILPVHSRNADRATVTATIQHGNASDGRRGRRDVSYYAEHKTHLQQLWKDWYAKNKERNVLRRAEWVKNNPEKAKAICHRTYWKDVEKSRREMRKSRARHLDARNAYDKKRGQTADRKKAKRTYAQNWKRKNREAWRLSHRLYQSRRRQRITASTVTIRDWLEILSRHGKKCAACGKVNCKLEIDHIVPFARGGRHEKSNLQPLCKRCNTKKHTKTMEEFLRRV